MHRLTFAGALLLTWVAGAVAQERPATGVGSLTVSPADLIGATIQFLARDQMGDRFAASAGAVPAAAFIAAQFRMLGLEPAGADGSFFRRVDAVGVASEGVLVVGGAGQTVTVPIGEGFAAWPVRPAEAVTVDGEMVFAGYGIHAEEYGWDDFGETPVVGRVLVVLSGDPGITDSVRFRGSNGTPYGTLAYKLEEAARRGARGLIILHDDRRSTWSWSQVHRVHSGEVLLQSGAAASELAFAAIMRLDRFRSLLSGLGRDTDVLISRSELPSFQPIPFGAHAVVRLRIDVRQVQLLSVIGRIPGGNPGSVSEEAVLVTAPYGRERRGASVPGDSVSLHASDAPGVAVMLGAAGAIRLGPDRPRRSVYFAAVAGSDYDNLAARELAAEPPVPAERIAAVVNVERPSVEGFPPVVTGIEGVAAGIDPVLSAAAVTSGVSVAPRSGHGLERFALGHAAFARLGVPSVTVRGGAADSPGQDTLRSVEGLALQARFVASLARLLADAQDRPAWSPDSPYYTAWDRLERRRLRSSIP